MFFRFRYLFGLTILNFKKKLEPIKLGNLFFVNLEYNFELILTSFLKILNSNLRSWIIGLLKPF